MPEQRVGLKTLSIFPDPLLITYVVYKTLWKKKLNRIILDFFNRTSRTILLDFIFCYYNYITIVRKHRIDSEHFAYANPATLLGGFFHIIYEKKRKKNTSVSLKNLKPIIKIGKMLEKDIKF